MRGSVGTFLSGIAAAVVAVPAVAEGLQRIDMSVLPLGEINLQGGSFIASRVESDSPYQSHLLAECQNCAWSTDAQVGLAEDATGDGRAFARNPEGYIQELEEFCRTQAELCAFSQSSVGGLPGYAMNARFEGGTFIVEHTYFSNGLMFVINAAGPNLDVAKANVATLIRVAGPYVAGQKP